MLDPTRTIRLPEDHPPMLLVVIDTEEEFDWDAPFDRNATTVHAMRGINRIQPIFDDFGIRPVYAIDYPVATQRASIDIIKPIVDAGRAVLAAHVHPWVNPPHEEEVTNHHSFPGHLPRHLEFQKLATLTDAIEKHFDIRPRIYKAGRYGVGPNTTQILIELSFEADLSTCPPLDVRDRGGRDFSRFPSQPYWFGADRDLLEIPHTGAFVGLLASLAVPLYKLTTSALLAKAHVPGILARLRGLDRLRLSPEGFTTDEHRRLTDVLLRRGVRVFCLSFHSPSLEVGYTPYVRTEEQLHQFIDRCRQYFDYFMNQRKGIATTPQELRRLLLEIR